MTNLTLFDILDIVSYLYAHEQEETFQLFTSGLTIQDVQFDTALRKLRDNI